MSTLTLCIVIVFCFGYLCIALESLTRVNKAAVALLMCVCCWTLLMVGPAAYYPEIAGGDVVHHIAEVIEHHLGDAAGTLFFLMGAMTIVEIVDSNGGFNFVRDTMKTGSLNDLVSALLSEPAQDKIGDRGFNLVKRAQNLIKKYLPETAVLTINGETLQKSDLDELLAATTTVDAITAVQALLTAKPGLGRLSFSGLADEIAVTVETAKRGPYTVNVSVQFVEAE